jgi:hypothetical protein
MRKSSGRRAMILPLEATSATTLPGSTEHLAEEALAGAVRRLCRGGSWQGLARELAWRAVTGGYRDARMVEGLATAAEAMLATQIDEALWQVEHAAIRGRDELLAERPGDLERALEAARLDAGEEAERLVVAAYDRVLDALLAAYRRAA